MTERSFLWVGVAQGLLVFALASAAAVREFGLVVLLYGLTVIVATVLVYGLLITIVGDWPRRAVNPSERRP